jgi:hypothetical protein
LFISGSASVHITSAEVTGNQAAVGGGMHIVGNSTTVVVETSNTMNIALVGGAMALEAGASLMVHNSKVEHNAALAGGAICAGTHTSVTVDKCEMTSNAATAGGALLAANAKATLRSSMVSNNIAAAGGGVYAESSTVFVTDRSTVTKNVAGAGGALFGAAGARFTVANGSVLISNVAHFGSAVWLQDNTCAWLTFAGGGRLTGSNSAATCAMPAMPTPRGMALDGALLEEPGAPDPIIPATSPGTSGSKLSLPVLSRCGAGSGTSAKPSGVRPLRPSAKCPGGGSGDSGNSKLLQQATLC